MRYSLSVITDEVSPDLTAGLKFAREEGLGLVDIRSIDGVNFLSLSPERQHRIAGEIKDAGLEVGCLATPLLKWPKPGSAAGDAGDQFGFDRKGRTDAELFEDACEAGALLGTRNLRIFSYLTYAGYTPGDLADDLGALLALADKYDMLLHVENEPVCNVATVSDLTALMEAYKHPRLKALLDICNADAAGAPATPADLTAVMPYVEIMHFKDHKGRHARVALGDGDVPFTTLLPHCFNSAAGRPLILTIETHMPDAPLPATRRSLHALQRLTGLAP